MALSDSRKKKLDMLVQSLAKKDFAAASDLLRRNGHSAINRHGAAPETSTPADLAEIAKSQAITGEDSDAEAKPPAAPQSTGPLTLVDACGGAETHLVIGDSSHKHWLIRKTLTEVDPECMPAAREFASVLRGARQRVDELKASPALCHVLDAQPEHLLFMDIETCGLYGTALFLVGMMMYEGDQLVFEQHLARDYTEEAAVLHRFARRLDETGVLVTFNGKTFDMNMIRDRCAFHGVDLGDRMPPHLDLLHESRRRWKGKLPNCKLQTLEKHLCGRLRQGDIPGWAIPDAYHRFVDNGDARALADILHHNLLDLLTMAQVLTAVITQCDPVEMDKRPKKG